VALLLCLPMLTWGVDRSVSSFEQREKKHVDRFDFSGEWPNMETIDIDARRKKRVEVDLTGSYPLLESINFEGGFGLLRGEITGDFPKLERVNFLCGSSAITLDLTSAWRQSCTITVRGLNEDVTLLLPADVGLVVQTKVGARGKVYMDGLKKKGFGIWKKNYRNPESKSSEIVLTINVETQDGNIIINTQ